MRVEECAIQNLVEEECDSAPGVLDSDPMEALIDQQAADGSFKFDLIFQNLSGLTLEEINAASPLNTSPDAWITALAVALLMKKFDKDKTLWELVADKAKKYLIKHVTNVDDLLEKAAKLC